MNIFEIYHKIEELLPKTAEKLNLEMREFRSHEEYLYNDNQFLLGQSLYRKMCFIVHKDLDFLNELLEISAENQLKLIRLSEIINKVNGDNSFEYSNFQKIQIDLTPKDPDTVARIKISDAKLGLTFRFSEDNVSLTDTSESLIGHHIILESGDHINDKIDEMITDFKEILFKKLNLPVGKDENSEEFKKHCLTKEEYINSRLKTTGLKYVMASTLIKNICKEIGMCPSNIDGERSRSFPNLRYVDKFAYNLTTDNKLFIKKLVPQVCKDTENETEQLINLLEFYEKLKTKDLNINVSFNIISKKDRLHTFFYKIAVGDLLQLTIGHDLKTIKGNDDILIIDEDIKNPVYKYAFRTNILNYQKSYLYLTNDLNYVYTTILTSMSQAISERIENIDDFVGSKHIELYKMLLI